MQKKHSLVYFYPWVIWFIASVFYSHQYMLRVSIAPLADYLMKTFHLDATMLGFFAASFFYAYMAVQFISGITVKRYGIKATIILATLLCGLGCLIISESLTTFWLFFGRSLIGAGSAFALLVAVVIVRVHFSQKRFPILNGLTITLGTIGAFLGGFPLAFYLNETTWRHVMLVFAIISFILTFLASLFIKGNPKNSAKDFWEEQNWRVTFKALVTVIKNKQVWLGSIFSGLLFTPIASFAMLWGVPFLQSEYHRISDLSLRFGVSLIFIGYGIGSPVIGWLSNYVSIKRLMTLIALVAFFISLLLIYVRPEFVEILYTLFFILGFLVGVSILSITYVKNQVSLEASPIAFSLVLIMISFSSALLLPLIGEMLDHFGQHFFLNGAEEFSTHSYHLALITIPIALFLGLVISLFFKSMPKKA
jgi:MFS family permease